MKRHYIPFFLSLIALCLTPYFSNGQEKKSGADSILKIVRTLRNDKVRAQTLIDFNVKNESAEPKIREKVARRALEYANHADHPKLIAIAKTQLAQAVFIGVPNRFDSALIIVEEAAKFAENNKLTVETFEALLLQGTILRTMDKDLAALRKIEESLEVAKKLKNPVFIARAEGELSIVYLHKGVNSLALNYARKSYEKLKTTQLEKQKAKSVSRLGLCFEALGKFDSALYYYQTFAHYAQNAKIFGDLGICYLNLAGLYRDFGFPEKSISQTRFNIRFARLHDLKNIEASALAALAVYKAKKLDFDSAILCFQKANRNWELLKFKWAPFQIDNLIGVGACLLKKNEIDSSIKILNKAYAISLQFRTYTSTKECLEELEKAYLSKEDFKSAFECSNNLIRINDSLNLQSKSAELANAEFRLGLEKIAQEKDALVKQQVLDKKLLAQKKQEQNLLAIALVILITIIIVVGILFYSRVKLNSELIGKSRVIENQKERLEVTLDENSKIQKQLIFSEKMASIGQLSAGLAHEINNPLNYISGGVSSLEELLNQIIEISRHNTSDQKTMDELLKDTREMMDIIKGGVKRSSSIVKNLRVLSSPKDQIDKSSKISLEDCIEGTLTLLRSKIRDHDITVETDLEKLPKVNANETLIQQVFVNLIDNAIQAIENKPGKKIISIKTGLSGNMVFASIKDNGSGIPEEIKQKIMNPFFTTKEVGKGNGLGLFICESIANQHNGTLTFTSDAINGTEFRLEIPIS